MLDVDDPQTLLRNLAVLRRRSRRSLGEPWFPAVCFGLITLLSAPLVAATGVIVLVPLWLVVGGAGLWLTRRHYRERTLATGATGRRSLWGVSLVIFCLCFLGAAGGGRVGGDAVGLGVPVVMVLLGYAVVGAVQRDVLPVLLVAPGAALALVAAAEHADAWLVELVFGLGLVTAGGVLRAVTRRRGLG